MPSFRVSTCLLKAGTAYKYLLFTDYIHFTFFQPPPHPSYPPTAHHLDCKMFILYQAWSLFFLTFASALTPAQWRSQSIYQVITDRFARTDGSTSAQCDVQRYCGGTWEGMINHLDYIQGMGFSAVSESPKLRWWTSANSTRFGSRLLYKTWRSQPMTGTHIMDTGRPTSTMSTRTSDLPRTS